MSTTDEDIYAAMIGGAPTTPERQAALARNLRTQEAMGQILQLSGDRVLAPFGEQLATRAQTGAGQIASERERERTAMMMEQYRAAQEKNMTDKLISAMQIAAGRNLTAKEVAQLRGEYQVEAAGVKAAGKPGGKALTNAQQKELSNFGDALDAITQAQNTFKPEYAKLMAPGGRPLANWLAAGGIGTQGMKDAQNWWSFYNRNFTLNEIHRLFGARFTAPEQQRFKEAHINENMDYNQSMDKLQSIQDQQRRMISRRLDEWESQGYNVNDVREQMGITREMSAHQPSGTAAPAGGAGGSAIVPPARMPEQQGNLPPIPKPVVAPAGGGSENLWIP